MTLFAMGNTPSHLESSHLSGLRITQNTAQVHEDVHQRITLLSSIGGIILLILLFIGLYTCYRQSKGAVISKTDRIRDSLPFAVSI